MSNKIREIQAVLESAGRANKYRVSFAFPQSVDNKADLKEIDVLAKSAIAPARDIGVIELWNQGRKLVQPGDTTFSNEWSLDFYLSEDHKLRYDFIKWQNACDNFHKNTHSGRPSEVMTSIRLSQLDSQGQETANYTLHNVFPMSVGEVTYGDDSENTVTEFNVSFSYTDFVIGTAEEDDYKLSTPSRQATA